MLQRQPSLDAVFHALADPTRRAIVERLVVGPASVTELSTPFEMSLSAIGQHVQLLQECGLVHTTKVGRVRRVELSRETFTLAERWFERHRKRWESRLDRLGALLAEDEDEDPIEPSPRTRPEPRRKKP